MNIEYAPIPSIGPKYLGIDNESLYQCLDTLAKQNNATVGVRGINMNRLTFDITFPEYRVDFPDAGGIHVPRLYVKSFNDGKTALQVRVGVYRIVCNNGLYIGIGWGQSLVHRDGPKLRGILDELPRVFNEGLRAIASGEISTLIESLSEEKLVNPIEAIAGLDIPSKVKDMAINSIILGTHREQDRPDTIWGTYNLVNEALFRTTKSHARAVGQDEKVLTDLLCMANNYQAA